MLWVDLLNRSLAWQEDGPRPARLRQDLALLRGLHAAAALGRPLRPDEEEGLWQWLAAVTLVPGTAEGADGSSWPRLRARRARGGLPGALEDLLSTSLVQMLAAADALAGVHRCHGLVRVPAPAGGYAPQDERAFAALAGVEARLRGDYRQCPRLVHAPRQAKYCSKACSNAGFAARKGEREPRYFAAKQQRYRRRQERRPRPGAFVFVD